MYDCFSKKLHQCSYFRLSDSRIHVHVSEGKEEKLEQFVDNFRRLNALEEKDILIHYGRVVIEKLARHGDSVLEEDGERSGSVACLANVENKLFVLTAAHVFSNSHGYDYMSRCKFLCGADGESEETIGSSCHCLYLRDHMDDIAPVDVAAIELNRKTGDRVRSSGLHTMTFPHCDQLEALRVDPEVFKFGDVTGFTSGLLDIVEHSSDEDEIGGFFGVVNKCETALEDGMDKDFASEGDSGSVTW